MPSRNASAAAASSSSIFERANPTWMRIQSPGWTFSFSRSPMLMALRTPLTFTFARSGRSRSSITSPGIPRHIPSPLILPLKPEVLATRRTVLSPWAPAPSGGCPTLRFSLRLRGPEATGHDLAGPLSDDADDALGEAHAPGLLQTLGQQCPAHREALAHEVLELFRLGDGVERAECLLQTLASVAGPDVVADCEADECFHSYGPPVRCLGTDGRGRAYMDLSSKYRLISGSDVMTSAAIPAVTTALISFMPAPPFGCLWLPIGKAPSPGCCGSGG